MKPTNVKRSAYRWHPLDTAPDGKLVLLLVRTQQTSFPYAVLSGYLDRRNGSKWLDHRTNYLINDTPIAWMPIPTSWGLLAEQITLGEYKLK